MRGLISFCRALPSILENPTFLIVAASWLLAQSFKVALSSFQAGRFLPGALLETGGMPSSHSAFVTSLAACVGLSSGWNSDAFLVALGFSIIVMHDAAGLRRAAGRHAALLNEVIEGMYRGRRSRPARMKEMLGHSPLQVLCGALLGLAMALFLYPTK